jgi:hypothetical protein
MVGVFGTTGCTARMTTEITTTTSAKARVVSPTSSISSSPIPPPKPRIVLLSITTNQRNTTMDSSIFAVSSSTLVPVMQVHGVPPVFRMLQALPGHTNVDRIVSISHVLPHSSDEGFENLIIFNDKPYHMSYDVMVDRSGFVSVALSYHDEDGYCYDDPQYPAPGDDGDDEAEAATSDHVYVLEVGAIKMEKGVEGKKKGRRGGEKRKRIAHSQIDSKLLTQKARSI